jgi:hypothetical protein
VGDRGWEGEEAVEAALCGPIFVTGVEKNKNNDKGR